MYEAHFGIERPPFQLTPDPEFYFGSAGHERALAELRRGLDAEQGIVVVSGDVGVGKTLMIQSLLRELASPQVVVGRLVTTQLDADGLLWAILNAFAVDRGSLGKMLPTAAFNAYLGTLAGAGRRAVLFIDEAQNVDAAAIDRLLQLDLGGRGRREVLKLCLVGQPELRDRLASGDLAIAPARIAVACHLGPLTADETGAYILHRLLKVGWSGAPQFEREALAEIHRWTGGVPRRINQLCNRLMLAAYLADEPVIDLKLVHETAGDHQAEIAGLSSLARKPAPSRSEPPRLTQVLEPAPSGRPMPTAVKPGRRKRTELAPPLPPPSRVAPPSVEPGSLLLVAAGMSDHVKAAVLWSVCRRRSQLPPLALVRAYRNDALDRVRPLFDGDAGPRIAELDVAPEAAQADRAEMLSERFEALVAAQRPVAVLLFDGSEAALVIGLAARRLGLPVFAVGTGRRGADGSEPGTPAAALTSRLVEQVADVIYTADGEAGEQLVRDGVADERVVQVGSLIVDALRAALHPPKSADAFRDLPPLVSELAAAPRGYGTVVLGARSTMVDRRSLVQVVNTLIAVSRDLPLIWPLHPQVHAALLKYRLDAAVNAERILCLPQLPYTTYAYLIANATCVLTDTWSVQEETTALEIPCLTIGTEPAHPVTVSMGSNVVVGNNRSLATSTVWNCLFSGGKRGHVPPLWDGHATERIADHVALYLAAAQAARA